MTPSTTLVQETIDLFKSLRMSVVEAMRRLYEIQETEAWTERADTWGEFCEEHLQISQSYASKLLSTYSHYVISGGVELQTLAGTDHEKLYQARSLPGTVEEQVAMAKTLTRRELKETKNEINEHTHEPVAITMCKSCGMRL